MTSSGIGASVKRKEDDRFISGKGKYTADVNLYNQTYAYFIRSPHAHARIKKIDISKATKIPGVLGIFTGDDVKKDKLRGLTYDQILKYLKESKKNDRLEKYKKLLKFRNIPFESDLFTWHNEDLV